MPSPAARRLRALLVHVGDSGHGVAPRPAASDGVVDLAVLEENGYVIVPQAVPQANVEQLKDEIADFLGMDLSQPEQWYLNGSTDRTQSKYQIGPGMVEMYQSQGMWDNRQHPKVTPSAV